MVSCGMSCRVIIVWCGVVWCGVELCCSLCRVMLNCVFCIAVVLNCAVWCGVVCCVVWCLEWCGVITRISVSPVAAANRRATVSHRWKSAGVRRASAYGWID